MKAYQKERIENAICFFAREHHKKTRRFPSQTHIYKYLALFEFEILEETGDAPLDLEYVAMEYGPVPIDIYSKRDTLKSDLFSIEKRGKSYFVKAKKKPNLDYFSEYEIEKMNNLIFIYAQRWVSSGVMSDASHEKIKAWKKAWNRRPNSKIDKADTFDKLAQKDEEHLSPQEERFLISSALGSMGA